MTAQAPQTAFVMISPDDLRLLIRQEVAAGMAARADDNRPQHMTTAQVAEYRGCSTATVLRLVRSGKLERTAKGITRASLDAL